MQCNRCLQEQNLNEFSLDHLGRPRKVCKQCVRIAIKEGRKRLPRGTTAEKRAKDRALKTKKYNDSNPTYKLSVVIRSGIATSYKRQGLKPPHNSLRFLGCSIEFLCTYIESQWSPGMNWDNHGRGAGTWSIDHIKACSSFDLRDETQAYLCFSYLNVRPLWESDHVKKSTYDNRRCRKMKKERALRDKLWTAFLESKIDEFRLSELKKEFNSNIKSNAFQEDLNLDPNLIQKD